MYKWDNIETKVELEFVLDRLKEKFNGIKIKRIFSFDDGIPRKIEDKIVYDTMTQPLYILFENKYALIMDFTNYSEIYIEYRKLTASELKESISSVTKKEIDYLNSYREIYNFSFDDKNHFKKIEEIKINGCYDKICDMKVNGFHTEYEKWINNGNGASLITIPKGGDYFDRITIILGNGIEISMCPKDAEMDGYYDLIIEDPCNCIKYDSKKLT